MGKKTTPKETSRGRFLNLLRNDILKVDLAELDFGIYRVLNYRRAEIDEFLTEKLPKLVEGVLVEESDARLEAAHAELTSLTENLNRSASGLGLTDAFPGGELEAPIDSEGRRVPATARLKSQPARPPRDSRDRKRNVSTITSIHSSHAITATGTSFLSLVADGMRNVVPYSGENTHFTGRIGAASK
jgi:hypothetical protein